MPDRVIVESNWLVDVILDQNTGSARLMDLVESGSVALFVPAFCLAEVVKLIERREDELDELSSLLNTRSSQFARGSESVALAEETAGLVEGLALYRDRLRERLWNVVTTTAMRARLVPTDADVMRAAGQIASQLELTPGDAIVLAAVTRKTDDCTEFISRDKRAFDTRRARTYMAEAGIKYFTDAAQFLGAHRL